MLVNKLKKYLLFPQKLKRECQKILFLLFFDKLFDIFCLVDIIALSSFRRTTGAAASLGAQACFFV
ncbi:hypothetical protein BBP23_01770 [Chlamydia trachomatis]|nr:hypothetical protein BBP23_01770 [Chlamydia trachomatis]ATW13700.1 hypothetical protein BKB98_01715 [Chlamydia trachomatis]